jgi:glycosyltransferase involved in cell wall biosynthesis
MGTPLVSICVPTYNGARFVDRALDSIAAQEYPGLEVVVVDDASTDGTVERIRARQDQPLRLFVHRRNRGHSATWNETVARAHGTLIKFLHQDDELRGDCVTRMVGALESAPRAGLVCSRRRIAFEDVPDEEAAAWLEAAGRLDLLLGPLGPVNDGRELLRRWIDGNLHGNAIGEPSAVMVRREALARVGGFAHHVAQATDMELWARIMAHYDVCFLDQELAVFRVGKGSLSFANRASRDSWLDRLWILEALSHDDDVRRAFPQLAEPLAAERRQAFRSALRLGRVREGPPVPVGPYLEYLRFRLGAALGRDRAPFARLP